MYILKNDVFYDHRAQSSCSMLSWACFSFLFLTSASMLAIRSSTALSSISSSQRFMVSWIISFIISILSFSVVQVFIEFVNCYIFMWFLALPIILAIPFITFAIWSIVTIDCNLNQGKCTRTWCFGAVHLGFCI